MKYKALTLMLLALGTIGLITSAIISDVYYDGKLGKTKTIETSCYDKYSNLILDQTCEKVVVPEPDKYLMALTLISIFLIFIMANRFITGGFYEI